MNAQQMWKTVYREWRKTHRYSTRVLQNRRDSMMSKRYTAALERKLEAAQRQITELKGRVWQLEAQGHNRDDGNEWEKQYYLRGMQR